MNLSFTLKESHLLSTPLCFDLHYSPTILRLLHVHLELAGDAGVELDRDVVHADFGDLENGDGFFVKGLAGLLLH